MYKIFNFSTAPIGSLNFFLPPSLARGPAYQYMRTNFINQKVVLFTHQFSNFHIGGLNFYINDTTSETTYKTKLAITTQNNDAGFNFYDFIEFSKTHSKYSNDKFPDTNFLTWFIGFSEADGSWFLNKNRKLFVIRQKDPTPLYFIYNTLNLGHIALDSDGYYSYRVYKQNEVQFLLLIFKNNVFLNHIKIKWKAIIELNNSVVLPTFNDAWLSGFTQGDGGFNITITKRENTKLGYRIRLRYYLDQKFAKSELLYIKSLLNSGTVNKRSGEEMFRYTLDSTNKLSDIKKYFLIYKLVGQKALMFENWAKVLEYLIIKKHLSEEGFNHILKLKEENRNLVDSVAQTLLNHKIS